MHSIAVSALDGPAYPKARDRALWSRERLWAAGDARAATGAGPVGGSGPMNTEKTMEQIMRRAAPLVCDPPMLVVDRITQSLRVVSSEEIEGLLAAHQRSVTLDQ